MTTTDVLEHHGILGMKWGVRRKRGADGRVIKNGGSGGNASSEAPSSQNSQRHYARSSKHAHLTNDQLNERINRIQLEKRYSELTMSRGEAARRRLYTKFEDAAVKGVTNILTKAIEAKIAQTIGMKPKGVKGAAKQMSSEAKKATTTREQTEAASGGDRFPSRKGYTMPDSINNKLKPSGGSTPSAGSGKSPKPSDGGGKPRAVDGAKPYGNVNRERRIPHVDSTGKEVAPYSPSRNLPSSITQARPRAQSPSGPRMIGSNRPPTVDAGQGRVRPVPRTPSPSLGSAPTRRQVGSSANSLGGGAWQTRPGASGRKSPGPRKDSGPVLDLGGGATQSRPGVPLGTPPTAIPSWAKSAAVRRKPASDLGKARGVSKASNSVRKKVVGIPTTRRFRRSAGSAPASKRDG